MQRVSCLWDLFTRPSALVMLVDVSSLTAPVTWCARCVMNGLLPREEAEEWVRATKGGRAAPSTPSKAPAKRPAAGAGQQQQAAAQAATQCFASTTACFSTQNIAMAAKHMLSKSCAMLERCSQHGSQLPRLPTNFPTLAYRALLLSMLLLVCTNCCDTLHAAVRVCQLL